MDLVAAFAGGLLLGAFLAWFFLRGKKQDARALAQELLNASQEAKQQDLDTVLDGIKDAFGNMSLEALSKNTDQFLKLAKDRLEQQSKMGGQDLEGKKKLIDAQLEGIKKELEKFKGQVETLGKEREKMYGDLTRSIKFQSTETLRLQETTGQLKEALASSKLRGQWGERMAEDVLRMAGFIEGINYRKQKSMAEGRTIPDYTFMLPQERVVNMDVKFPLSNYMRYLEAETEAEKDQFKKAFIKDVKNRIKEVTSRDYIDPASQTVDFVVVFIPNEQVYAFIHEHDRTVLDDAMHNKVILCSPLTLYAILAIIRQAVDNFNLEQTTGQILKLYGSFKKQWDAFKDQFDKVGKKLDDAQKEYDKLVGTRTNQLDRQLNKIEELRTSQGIALENSD